MRKTLLTLSLLAIFSCTENRKPTNTDFIGKHTNAKEIQFENLKLDKIDLDYTHKSHISGSGITPEGGLYFIDNKSNKINFDTTGKHINTQSGGNLLGSDETVTLTHAYLPNNDLITLSNALGYHTYDNNHMIKDTFSILYKRSTGNIPEQLDTYVSSTTDRHLVCRAYGQEIFVNVKGMNPDFNPFTTDLDYYFPEAYNIRSVDLTTKAFSKLFAKGYPNNYSEKSETKRIFYNIDFDIDKKCNFYVSYEADSLIYVFDRNNTPITSFGYQGVDMNTDYLALHSVEEWAEFAPKEEGNKGHYGWVEYIDETNTLFRSYKKGPHSEYDGLQIYRDNKLIADVEVPKGTRITGYIAPYYYTHILENWNDHRVYLYKFKL